MLCGVRLTRKNQSAVQAVAGPKRRAHYGLESPAPYPGGLQSCALPGAKGYGAGQSLKINESAIGMSTLRLAIYLVIFASCACSATSIRAAETTSPIGLWKNEDATFEIFENGGKLSARIVALREPKTPEGKEKNGHP